MLELSGVSLLSRFVKDYVVLDTGDNCDSYSSLFLLYCSMCWSLLVVGFGVLF